MKEKEVNTVIDFRLEEKTGISDLFAPEIKFMR